VRVLKSNTQTTALLASIAMDGDDWQEYDAAASTVRSSVVTSPTLAARGMTGMRQTFVASLRSTSASQRRPASAILGPNQHASSCVKAKEALRLSQVSVPTSQDIRSTIFPLSPAPFIESKVHVGIANLQPNFPRPKSRDLSFEAASTVKFVDICRENDAASMNPDNLTTPFTRCSRAQLKPALPRAGYIIAPAKMKIVVELEKVLADACATGHSSFNLTEEAAEQTRVQRSRAFLGVLKTLEQSMPKLETILSPIVAELEEFFGICTIPSCRTTEFIKYHCDHSSHFLFPDYQKRNNAALKERVNDLLEQLQAEQSRASGATKSRELVEAEERIRTTLQHNLELNTALINMKEELEAVKDDNRRLVEHSKGLARTATEQNDQLLLFKQGYKSIRDVVKKEASGAQKELSIIKDEIASHYVARDAYDKLNVEAGTVLMRAENAEALHIAAMDRCSRLLVDKMRLEKQVTMLKTMIFQLRIKCNWTPAANAIFQRTDLNEKSVLREFFISLNKTIKSLEQRVFDLENPAEVDTTFNVSLMKPDDPPLGPDAFEGFGDDEAIPKFVRTSKRVKHMHLKKYQVEKAIKGIFQARKVSTNAEDIGGFIFSYFKLQIGSDEKTLEWGYSLVYGCEKFADDADCEMFLCIVRGQVSESLYLSQLDACTKFEKACADFDKKKTKGCGKITAKS
jgi:hypothetical protein